MHYSKRFIAFGGIVAIAFLIKYNIPGAEYEQIGSFRGASLEAETWNPLIASSVNDNLLSVIIDNKQYTNEKYKFYMDDNLDIMMPVSILSCSFSLVGGGGIVLYALIISKGRAVGKGKRINCRSRRAGYTFWRAIAAPGDLPLTRYDQSGII